MTQEQHRVQPKQFSFKDDGIFPNSVLPLLFYRQAMATDAEDLASIVEEHFAENDWANSWRDGVYSFPHYHSTSHEVLGVYRGTATLQLGGEHGRNVEVHAGDVIVIPAGVAHQNIGASDDFGVVGAYPAGRQWDLLRGLPSERPKADQNIAALPVPDNDPIYGAEGPLRHIWKSSDPGPKIAPMPWKTGVFACLADVRLACRRKTHSRGGCLLFCQFALAPQQYRFFT